MTIAFQLLFSKLESRYHCDSRRISSCTSGLLRVQDLALDRQNAYPCACIMGKFQEVEGWNKQQLVYSFMSHTILSCLHNLQKELWAAH